MIKILALSFTLFSLYAGSLGSGSKFKVRFTDDPSAVDLSIYITDSNEAQVNVEYYFSTTNSLIPVEMWQQFHFKKSSSGVLPVAGYVLTHKAGRPEKLPPNYLKVQKGVQVHDFMFSSKAEIAKDKVGEEKIKTPAGEVLATHYRKKRDGQQVDFWVADEAKPIGLVKLISKGSKRDQRYTIVLGSLIKNVRPSINAEKSIPLTVATKALLPKPI